MINNQQTLLEIVSTYISMKIEPNGKIPPNTVITVGSMNLKYIVCMSH